jgi:hypothetical protein
LAQVCGVFQSRVRESICVVQKENAVPKQHRNGGDDSTGYQSSL